MSKAALHEGLTVVRPNQLSRPSLIENCLRCLSL
ncbi:hypothetical protein BOKEGFJH_00713 [Chlamydia avium]|nr:hypothetical protein BOKEGFJH_00713 [Chlamydia avium]